MELFFEQMAFFSIVAAQFVAVIALCEVSSSTTPSGPKRRAAQNARVSRKISTTCRWAQT
jgi:hypothetical protein